MGESKQKLAAALVKAQAAIEGAEKDRPSQFPGQRYVSVESMVRAVREPLHRAGLALVGIMQEVDWRLTVENEPPHPVLRRRALLLHESGEELELVYELPIVTTRGQALDFAVLSASSKALTYMLRDLGLVPRGEPEADPEEEPLPPAGVWRDDKAAPGGQARLHEGNEKPVTLGETLAEGFAEKAVPPSPLPPCTGEFGRQVADEAVRIKVGRWGVSIGLTKEDMAAIRKRLVRGEQPTMAELADCCAMMREEAARRKEVAE